MSPFTESSIVGSTRLSAAFEPAPQHWGLRGDPGLWDEFKHLAGLPDGAGIDQLHSYLAGLFQGLTGGSLDDDDQIRVRRLAGPGMSGGFVSPRFWRQRLIPMLLQRCCPGRPLSVMCWNVNHRLGRMPFRPEAAPAAIATDADVLVFTEFFAQERLQEFRATLHDGGWRYQALSETSGPKANGILFASRVPLTVRHLPPSPVDHHLMSNALHVRIDDALEVFSVRVPTYTGQQRLDAWDWIQKVAADVQLVAPALLIGDLNTSLSTRAPVPQFGGLLRSWRRLQPLGTGSFFGSNGIVSEIDHALIDGDIDATAWYLRSAGDYELANSESAISDHAGLFVQLSLPRV